MEVCGGSSSRPNRFFAKLSYKQKGNGGSRAPNIAVFLQKVADEGGFEGYRIEIGAVGKHINSDTTTYELEWNSPYDEELCADNDYRLCAYALQDILMTTVKKG